jgi:uncharacterized protein (PEP-CTERM system associated)
VTRLNPAVTVNGRSARIRLHASYSPEIIYRAQEGRRDVFHSLNYRGDAELVQQLLFVDTSANISQQNISLLAPQAQDNINSTGNRTNVTSFRVSPYLRRSFGNDAQAELRYTYSTIDSSAVTSFSDSESNRIDMRLWSGPAFKLLTWNLAYSKQSIAYTQGQDVDTEIISADARRLITHTLGLQVSAGYEDNNYVTLGPSPKGSFWSVGPEWRPTPRTLLAATTGRRYFGPTRSVTFNHRTRLTTWSLDYNEDITTARQELLIPTTADATGLLDSLFLSRFPDPVVRQQAVQAFISQTGLPPSLTVPLNFFTTTPFLLKRWRTSFGIHGARNTVIANVFTETREATISGQAGGGDFAASRDTKQSGVSLLWTLRMTPHSTSNLSAGYSRNEFPGLSRMDNVRYFRINLTQQFQPRLSGSLSYRRLENDSNQTGAGYTENAVSAALHMRF